ncbi:MAG: FecR family protein [Spirochaetota bacterium]
MNNKSKIPVKLAIYLFLLLILPAYLLAQAKGAPTASLEYYDNENEIQIFNAKGTPVTDIYYGMNLALGDTIKTKKTTAELKLDPNGSIIKLAENTQFTVETLQGKDENVNGFALITGKIRTVAARKDGSQNYSIRTPSAVCGVRGTDFGLEAVLGSRDAAAVLVGEIEFINVNTGQSLKLTAGMAADVYAPRFEPIQLPIEELKSLFQEMDFKKLNPLDVPGYPPPAAAKEEPAAEAPAPAQPEAPPPEPKKEVKKEGPFDKFLKNLGKYFGMEMGTLTVENETYAKAILQPHFNIGKLKLSLYLPIIYQSNLFDPKDWYHPKGNDEWSFGTDKTGALAIVSDLLSDLALKIRYIQWGEQRDPFFFKVGNLNNMTLGHGILMYYYANDKDFPAIRRIGINLGMDFKAIGFEAVVNDLADLQIMGGRFYFRPAPKSFPMAIGFSSIVDIKPSAALPQADPENPVLYGDPIFWNSALDIDFPIIHTKPFSFILFADIAGMVPYFREADPDYNIEKGLATSALYRETGGSFSFSNFNNFGISTGLFGNILMADYRLEFRYFKGTFKPAFYNSTYDRTKGEYVEDLAAYFADPAAEEFNKETMGVYGQLGFNILDKFYLEAGYFWPWSIVDGSLKGSDDDFLHIKVGINPKVIPVVGVYGSISYDRSKFIPTLLGKGDNAKLSLFDVNTVVRGELAVPVAPILDLAAIISTSVDHNADGSVKIDPDTELPKISPAVTIETRLHF